MSLSAIRSMQKGMESPNRINSNRNSHAGPNSNSNSNLMQDEPMQSAGLSSSPDDYERQAKTPNMSHSLTTGSFQSTESETEGEVVHQVHVHDGGDDSDLSDYNNSHRQHISETHVPEQELEDVEFQDEDYDNSNDNYEAGEIGRLANETLEEEIVFGGADGSDRDSDSMEEIGNEEESEGENMNDSAMIMASIPDVWAAEDDYQDREAAPSDEGEEESEEFAGLEYENVEYDGCIGRLVLTDDELLFYRFEEAMLEIPWSQVEKRQVSPTTFKAPLLRIKTTDSGDLMFRLASQEMADLMREDLKVFEASTADASRRSSAIQDKNLPRGSQTSRATDNDELPRYKIREDASRMVGGAPPEDPLLHDEEEGGIEGDFDDEDEHPLRAKIAPLLTHQSSRSSTSFGGVDDEIDESDPLGSPRDIESAKERAVRERDALVKEQQEQAKRNRELREWVCLACCCSAIICLLLGGLAGYFIAETTLDTDGSSDATAPVAIPTGTPLAYPGWLQPSAPTTPEPTVAVAPTIAPIIASTPEPTVAVAPTIAPSQARSNQTSMMPTRRGFPPRLTDPPTATESTGAPSISLIGTEETAEPTLAPTPVDSTPEPTAGTTTVSSPAPSSNSTPSTLMPSLGADVSNTTSTLSPTSMNLSQPTIAPSDGSTTTWSPTVSTALLELLREVSPDQGSALNTVGTPQQRAYRWVDTEDQIQESLTEPKQIQRYSLATFYYSTGGSAVWNSLQRQGDASKWLDPTKDDCEWGFIICNDAGEILALELIPPSAPTLAGSLPPELGLLSMLKDLVVTTGNAEEAAEARQAQQELKEQKQRKMQEVVVISSAVSNTNMLTGSIPSEIGNLQSLETLRITNQALGGNLPTEVGNLASIIAFDISNNQFSGLIPIEIGSLAQIQELNLGFNSFQARIKPGIFNQENGMAQSLRRLFLNNNQLNRDLPTELGLLTNLETGLYLEGNRFTGPLPSELGLMRKLKVFRVDYNSLTGTIPSDFRQWSQIEEFQVQGNGFRGSVPGDVCRLFLVQGTVAYTECEFLTCRCCTHCCSNGECQAT